jgi:poly(3-hydroxyalkanoate) synthetase
MGDLGNGKFDGAWLVSNFENLNPANTYWSKQYNLYSKIDTEAPRYLGFERWWGGHVNLNAEEIQFIVDELFVGNKLAAGAIQTSDGRTIDLRNIRSPIVVFCSEGDNITPPQQALGWILDLYEDVDDIRSYGQTIVYTIHKSIGHLGIFVSGGVARKEHGEFSSNIDLIDLLPLRSHFRGKVGRLGKCRPDDGRLGDAMRGSYARRHPSAWRQRCG